MERVARRIQRARPILQAMRGHGDLVALAKERERQKKTDALQAIMKAGSPCVRFVKKEFKAADVDLDSLDQEGVDHCINEVESRARRARKAGKQCVTPLQLARALGFSWNPEVVRDMFAGSESTQRPYAWMLRRLEELLGG